MSSLFTFHEIRFDNQKDSLFRSYTYSMTEVLTGTSGANTTNQSITESDLFLLLPNLLHRIHTGKATSYHASDTSYFEFKESDSTIIISLNTVDPFLGDRSKVMTITHTNADSMVRIIIRRSMRCRLKLLEKLRNGLTSKYNSLTEDEKFECKLFGCYH